jgi:hypothetical protein
MNYTIDLDDEHAKTVYNLVRGDLRGLKKVLEIINQDAKIKAIDMCLDLEGESSYNRGYVRGMLECAKFLEGSYRLARKIIAEGPDDDKKGSFWS